jgi:nickel-type superoxide dismutase maturation protease
LSPSSDETGIFPLARFRIEDRSMAPSMAPGDFVIVNRWSYKLGKPAQGDVVVLRDPENPGGHLVKRIASIATSGGYFVVGDNMEASRDSRAFGPIAKDLIVGRVWRHVKP